ncbi:MAG: hypothetical protein ACHQ0J_14790 [Candidatus Dormibacterales bacterium]
MNRFDTRFGPDAKRPAARMRVKLIAAASITTGIVAGVLAAGGAGSLGFLHPSVAQRLVKSRVASIPLDASALFPMPTRIEQSAPSGVYVAYVVPAIPKQPQPMETNDDRPSTQPAQSQPGAGGGGGGDS